MNIQTIDPLFPAAAGIEHGGVPAVPGLAAGQKTGPSKLNLALGSVPSASPALAKVKLLLKERTDDRLDMFVSTHLRLIADDPAFPDQQPAPEDMEAALTEYQAALAAQRELMARLKAATTTKEMRRKKLESLVVGRGAYVQMVSKGNAALIERVGLGVKNAASVVGPLAPPINLRTELNGTRGVMKLSWQGVPYARGFIVECSPDVMPREFAQIKYSTKTSLILENLELGKTLVFRIASQGGSTGQSPWSAEVIRGAA